MVVRMPAFAKYISHVIPLLFESRDHRLILQMPIALLVAGVAIVVHAVLDEDADRFLRVLTDKGPDRRVRLEYS